MAIWSDVIEPAVLTAYTRDLVWKMDGRGASLGQFLPNNTVDNIRVSWTPGIAEHTDTADYRDWDTEPTQGRLPGGEEKTMRLAPVGRKLPVAEFDQVIAKGREAKLEKVLNVTRVLAKETLNAIEYQRANALLNGRIVIPEIGVNTDFGRDADMTVTAPTLWNDPTASRLEFLNNIIGHYADKNGETPGCLYMSRRAFLALAQGTEFATVLMGGAQRMATVEDVESVLTSYGVPKIVLAERKINGQLVIPDNKILALPAPVAVNSPNGTQLGATMWGQTLAATEGGFSMGDNELPGLVAVAESETSIPFRKSVTVDALALPVLMNPNLSMVATVL